MARYCTCPNREDFFSNASLSVPEGQRCGRCGLPTVPIYNPEKKDKIEASIKESLGFDPYNSQPIGLRKTHGF